MDDAKLTSGSDVYLAKQTFRRTGMQCNSCGSVNQQEFIGEMGIRRPGLKYIGDPVVWVLHELIVCQDCGRAEFVVPETELELLAKKARQLQRDDLRFSS
jgi:hypothetical protein